MWQKNIRLLYKECADGLYKGAYVDHAGDIQCFDWEFDADIADNVYPPEITYLQDKIKRNHHLLVQFTQKIGHGDSTRITEAHMVDLDTMTEVPIQSPTEILEKENITEDISGVTYKVEKAKLICDISLQADIDNNIEIIYEYKDGSYQVSILNYIQ